MEREQLQLQQVALYVLATISISFWAIIWIMHLCALTNAKMKFGRKSYFFAANKRKTKQAVLQQPQHHHHHHLDNNNNNNNPFQLADQQLGAGKPTHAGQLQHQNLTSYHHQQSFKNDAQTFTQQFFSSIDNESSANNQRKPSSDAIHQQDESPGAICDSDHCLCFEENSDRQMASAKHLEKHMLAHNTQTSLIDLNKYTNYYFFIDLPLPGVSIIKPLVGVDKNLFFNLETFFHLDYPTYEILFCVQEQDDPAAAVVQQLFKKYPRADARLFVGGARVGVNPKINNMQPAYESMKYELILISDSGIQMKPDTLMDMVGHMHDDVALVHQMPFVNFHERDSFQSIVEQVYFGTVHARAYLTADLLNINCPTGMSALMRKCLLDEVGGIKAFGQYLAEDFFFAKSFTERGWKICISSQPALQNSANSSDTLATLNSRIQRWIKLRFAMVPQWTLIEPFSECMLIGLLGAVSISFMWAINPIAVFALHVLVWFLLDYKLICTIQNEPLTCSKTKYVAAWLIRESTALLVFTKALLDPKVTWRSREFKLKWGGYTEEVSQPLVPPPPPLKKTILNQHHQQVPILTQKATDYAPFQEQKLPQCITCAV